MLNEQKLIEALKKIDTIIRDLLDVIDPKPGVITYQKAGRKHKIAEKPCKRCGGLISWDGYDKETRPYPLHVDEEGFEIKGCYDGTT